MHAPRPSDGAARRTTLAVHARLQIELQAKRAGLKFTGWRGEKPVVRVKMGSKT